MVPRMFLVALCLIALGISCTEGAGTQGCIFPNTCSLIGTGRFRDCRYCNTFITCDHRRPYVTICNPWATSIYNYVQGVCALDTKGVCSKRMQPPIGTSEAPVTAPTKPSCPFGKYSCCVRSCYGLPDGEYGSCISCNHFVYCTNGQIIQRNCAAGLAWDDYVKGCVHVSSTCKGLVPTPTPSCIRTQECRSEFKTNKEFCVRVPAGTKVIGVKLIPVGGPGSPFSAYQCIPNISYDIETGLLNGQIATYLYTGRGCCAEFTLDVCPPGK